MTKNIRDYINLVENKNIVKSVQVGNFRHDLIDTGFGWQVRIYNGLRYWDEQKLRAKRFRCIRRCSCIYKEAIKNRLRNHK